jgi:hypothetical protein
MSYALWDVSRGRHPLYKTTPDSRRVKSSDTTVHERLDANGILGLSTSVSDGTDGSFRANGTFRTNGTNRADGAIWFNGALRTEGANGAIRPNGTRFWRSCTRRRMAVGDSTRRHSGHNGCRHALVVTATRRLFFRLFPFPLQGKCHALSKTKHL